MCGEDSSQRLAVVIFHGFLFNMKDINSLKIFYEIPKFLCIDHPSQYMALKQEPRAPLQFAIGCSKSIKLLKSPCYTAPQYTEKYCELISTKSSRPYNHHFIGKAIDDDPRMSHRKTRNCICKSNDNCYFAFNSNVQMINNITALNSLNVVSPSISARSFVTEIKVNSQNSFGVLTTLKGPALFSIAEDKMHFDSINFADLPQFQIGDNNTVANIPTDFYVSDFINGEAFFITNNGEIIQTAGTDLGQRFRFTDLQPFEYGAIASGNNPRVCVCSFLDKSRIIDFRQKNIYETSPVIDIPRVTSIMQSKNRKNDYILSNDDGFYILDIRFPAIPQDHIKYLFESPVVSFQEELIEGRVNAIFAQCCKSCDIIVLPYGDDIYSEPSRPIDLQMAEFQALTKNSLIGLQVVENQVYAMFENQSVVNFTLDPSSEAKRHYFIDFQRIHQSVDYDSFELRPSFPPLQRISSSSIKWDEAFEGMSEAPPGLLRPGFDEYPETEDVEGYLIEIEDTLMFQDEDLEQIMPIYFKSHLDIVRQNQK